ncbi:serine/arginine repetitive matrix protein 5-like [Chelonus insularis]|uniref:serine/arginine repetitive matrix protein 5-like n=1 Tax=Chelonus insularis TaxID=460826 RepID=UPI001589F50D|nr:serine/arginine repetitive matrix protein 5-like [Chelonus insularis]
MLLRSTSSRRRRASRSVASSPQSGSVPGATTRVRRASVATDRPISLSQNTTNSNEMDRQRSPRSSIVPNIAFDAENGHDEPINRRILPDPEYCGSRGLLPDTNRSPRNSLVPDDYSRSPRGSLIPDSGRSPRNSLVPDGSRSPRHSLVPDGSHSPRNPYGPEVPYNRSPRNSLIPSSGPTSRNTLMPENGSIRTSRHSLLPETTRSPRGSVANIDFDRSPRGSICPEISRSARGSIAVPIDQDRSTRGSICAEMIASRSPRGSITPAIDPDRNPRGSISSEYHNPSPRGSIMPECNKSPRGSIGPDSNRSSRGSIGPEGGRSPRGSIAPHEGSNRSPRGSVGVPEIDRNHRGSIGEDGSMNRSPRGSIGLEIDRSPRGSLGGYERRTHRGNNLPYQEPRRASADQGISTSRSGSPYRGRDTNTGNIRSSAAHGAPTNLGYGTNAWVDSRRASSSVSQLSGDESRRLCMRSVNSTEKGITSDSGGVGVATYGSLVFQLKDAHREASGTCDFVFRAMGVVSKTMLVTICLACLSTMPIIMLIMGLQFIKDCPKEPNIPVYMIVGGALGGVRMFWALYSQIRSRRLEVLSVPNSSPHISPMQLVSIALTCFLTFWFGLGNYWILKIRWPDFEAKMFDPNHWCAKTLYIFAVVHLGIIYAVIGVSIVTALGLAICRALACSWFERYK